MIAAAFIVHWREVVPWAGDHQVEHDLILSRALISLVAFLDGSDAGGTQRFTPDTRRVYRQLLKHFALLVFQARRDLFGGGAAAWVELCARFTATGSRPNPKYRRAWALWTARCRRRAIDPFAPPDPARDFDDFVRYLEGWGYSGTTFKRYGWIIQSLLALLGAGAMLSAWRPLPGISSGGSRTQRATSARST